MKVPLRWLVTPIVALIASSAGGGAAGLKIGANAPRFALQDQDGKNVTLDGLTGKIVVLEWFDPECDYTKRDFALARTPQKLAERYKGKGVVWLGVNSTRNSSKEKDKAWIKENELPYAVLDDATQEVAKAYGVGVVPRYVIIDKNGTVAYVGSIDDDESRNGVKREEKINFVDRALDEMTAGKAVTKPQGLEYGCPLR